MLLQLGEEYSRCLMPGKPPRPLTPPPPLLSSTT
jgi:hypothetical protein